MINAYVEGKDLYSVIASMAFDRPYEDCLEFYPEGTKINYEDKEVVCGYKTHQNKEGKQYRTFAKSILLGVIYGRGAKSVGEQIGKTKEEAQVIIDKFFKAFPKVKKWIDDSMASAHKLGYVEDVAGRRRRLPDIQLPKYEIKFTDPKRAASGSFNPFIGCKDRVDTSSNNILNKYKRELKNAKYQKQYEKIQADALKNGVIIHNNTGFIAQAERQAVNSRVQGGAATLTKCALLQIFRDQRLRDIEAKLINTVHDEILIEVPKYYSEKAEELLTDDMVGSAKKLVTNVPMKTDTYNVWAWYLDEYAVTVENEFKKLLEQYEPMEAFEKMCELRSESTRDQIYELVAGYMPEKPANVNIIHTL